jgi:hypothetical protein
MPRQSSAWVRLTQMAADGPILAPFAGDPGSVAAVAVMPDAEERSPPEPLGQSTFAATIRQVCFNAWHYSSRVHGGSRPAELRVLSAHIGELASQ